MDANISIRTAGEVPACGYYIMAQRRLTHGRYNTCSDVSSQAILDGLVRSTALRATATQARWGGYFGWITMCASGRLEASSTLLT